jgi:CDP-paratose 2-epimerase
LRILVTGACGFAGSVLIRSWAEDASGHRITGLDNLLRPGSEINRHALRHLGVRVIHADIRSASDLEELPDVDVVIDAAGSPSVLAGVDGVISSRQLVEHNLLGTLNLLEFCRARKSGFILLSTSRVYSISPLAQLRTRVVGGAFEPDADAAARLSPGLSANGITEDFSTDPPVSLYGATKIAGERLALEYGATYDFSAWINRCGVLAGAGQFGRPDQGIFAYWINCWLRKRPLKFIGFDGQGHQVRDCLHPADLRPLLDRQIASTDAGQPRVVNVGGGRSSAMSLRQLSHWCRARFGEHEVGTDTRPRPFDLPWVVLDSARAEAAWDWTPTRTTGQILEEIARHGEAHPEWLALSESC